VKNLVTVEPLRDGPAGATSQKLDVKGKIVELLWQLERDGRKPSTIKNYSKLFRAALKHGANLFDPEDVKGFLAKIQWKDSTKRNAVAMLDVWFRFIGTAWRPPTYQADLEIPFTPTEEEIDQLIAACGKTMATYLQILKETGARCGEISKLTWMDIDSKQRTVRIKPEKGSLPRILPLSPKALEMLNNLPRNREHLFVTAKNMRSNFYRQRKRIARKLGNPRLLQIHFHTLRHWRGTEEYHKTKDPMWVKEFLGHKDLKSTQVYIHIERARYRNAPPDDFHVNVATTQREITQLLEAGFEYVLEKDGIAYFRKRK
jgi:integrase